MPFVNRGIGVPIVEDLGPLLPARDAPREPQQVEQLHADPPRAPQHGHGQGQGRDRERRRQNLLLRGIDLHNIIPHGRLRPRP